MCFTLWNENVYIRERKRERLLAADLFDDGDRGEYCSFELLSLDYNIIFHPCPFTLTSSQQLSNSHPSSLDTSIHPESSIQLALEVLSIAATSSPVLPESSLSKPVSSHTRLPSILRKERNSHNNIRRNLPKTRPPPRHQRLINNHHRILSHRLHQTPQNFNCEGISPVV